MKKIKPEIEMENAEKLLKIGIDSGFIPYLDNDTRPKLTQTQCFELARKFPFTISDIERMFLHYEYGENK